MMKKRARKIKNWSAQGEDQLRGFGLKHLTSLHPLILVYYMEYSSINYIKCMFCPNVAQPWEIPGWGTSVSQILKSAAMVVMGFWDLKFTHLEIASWRNLVLLDQDNFVTYPDHATI